MSGSAGIKISEGQIAAAKTAFTAFDKRNEDQLKVGDIADAMKKIGHSIKAEWLEKMEEDIDTEGTGYVKFEEFVTIVQRKMQSDEDDRELKDMFRVLDKEKKGEINVTELRWILKRLDDLSEEDIDVMIAEVDTDGSGWIDFEEFKSLMNS